MWIHNHDSYPTCKDFAFQFTGDINKGNLELLHEERSHHWELNTAQDPNIFQTDCIRTLRIESG
jgi:hypothetical protein